MIPQSVGIDFQCKAGPCCMVRLLDAEQFIIEIDDALPDANEETVAAPDLSRFSGCQLLFMNTRSSLHISYAWQIFIYRNRFDLRNVLLTGYNPFTIEPYLEVSMER